jgi:hypothetical protein
MERHNANMTDETVRAWRLYVMGAHLGVTLPFTAKQMQEAIASANRACKLEIEPATGYGVCVIY